MLCVSLPVRPSPIVSRRGRGASKGFRGRRGPDRRDGYEVSGRVGRCLRVRPKSRESVGLRYILWFGWVHHDPVVLSVNRGRVLVPDSSRSVLCTWVGRTTSSLFLLYRLWGTRGSDGYVWGDVTSSFSLFAFFLPSPLCHLVSTPVFSPVDLPTPVVCGVGSSRTLGRTSVTPGPVLCSTTTVPSPTDRFRYGRYWLQDGRPSSQPSPSRPSLS